MPLFAQDISPGEYILSVLFLLAVLLCNLYTAAKFLNTVRALTATRFFTSAPIKGGLVKEEPVVTIQICAYNEESVIEDTINAACSVDWPRDKLFVQVCDDSNDKTTDIIEAAAARWREQGVRCERLSRPNRMGYKAGSLQYHTDKVQGDFLALFDADHHCEPQLLRRAIPHFFDDNGNHKDSVGLVQLPGAYYNTHQNLLTEYDALNLDVSHVIEQTGRAYALKCFGFNGTGGVWRREAIQAGGGWQWDTVTEDLDLSYLAHMAGYDFVYLRDLPQQLELPAGIRAHVQQKHRWTKGFLQVTRKSLWNILTSKQSTLTVKFEAVTHMTGAVSYLMTLITVLLTPVLVYLDIFTRPLTILAFIPILSIALANVITIFAKVSGSNGDYKTIWARMVRCTLVAPISCLMAMGMIVFETYAILDGLFSNDATFIRTPKEGSAAATGAIADGHTTSIIDYIKEEDEERSGNNRVSEASAASITSKMDQNKCFSPSKYTKDLFLGLVGLLLVGYFVVWGVVLFFLKPRGDSHGLGLAQRSFVLAPIPGLMYFHGSFVMALLGSSFSKLLSNQTKRLSYEKKSPSLKTVVTVPLSTALPSEQNGLPASSDDGGKPEKKEA